MRTEVIEETKNMDFSVKGEEYVYHYIEYRLFKAPKEVRITKYNGGRYNGDIQKVEVIHKGERFSRHVKPKIPFKKQLIKIPFKPEDFVQLYSGNVETINIDHDDAVLEKNGVSKDTIEELYYMKIADHYKEINEYYAELNKTIAQERDERERREMEDGPAEAYHEELDSRYEWHNANAAVDAVVRELDEDEDLEDEESEDDDDFFETLEFDDDD
ncbi:MAG: hypothetical protein IJF83_04780 [Methanobrevibacter sp.]|nr:hypothetical protein [Methanobrevibacter sp.]MBQ6628823.1 hypothetical protein [Methanobrevibacter sp.]